MKKKEKERVLDKAMVDGHSQQVRGFSIKFIPSIVFFYYLPTDLKQKFIIDVVSVNSKPF